MSTSGSDALLRPTQRRCRREPGKFVLRDAPHCLPSVRRSPSSRGSQEWTSRSTLSTVRPMSLKSLRPRARSALAAMRDFIAARSNQIPPSSQLSCRSPSTARTCHVGALGSQCNERRRCGEVRARVTTRARSMALLARVCAREIPLCREITVTANVTTANEAAWTKNAVIIEFCYEGAALYLCLVRVRSK
jgi:hypothetical protein